MITITIASLIAICFSSRGDWANVLIIALSGSPSFFGEMFWWKILGDRFWWKWDNAVNCLRPQYLNFPSVRTGRVPDMAVP